MRGFVRRHRLAVFFAAAFLLSWYPWFIALARGTTTGPNPLGPLVAALLVTGIASGRAGLRDLLRRFAPSRAGVDAYLIAVGLPIILSGLVAAAAALFVPVTVTPVRWQDVVESFLFIFVFIALGEEPGWRGFALPELLRRFRPATASLVLGAIWTVWHLPLMGSEFPLPIVPAFAAGVFAGTFVQTWLFRRSGGALLPQMILHATVNTVGSGLVFRWFAAADQQVLWSINAVVWIAAAATAHLASRNLPVAEDAPA